MLTFPTSRSRAASEPKDTSPGFIESAFDSAWDGVVSGAHKTAKAGDWVVEKTNGGAIVVWREVKTASQGAAQEAGDTAILTAIKGRLAADPSTSARKIHVDVDKAVVTLRGDVSGPAEAKTAIRLATETSGVNRVVSHLRWPSMTKKR
jgi:osmotically-inducible protein OsmY